MADAGQESSEGISVSKPVARVMMLVNARVWGSGYTMLKHVPGEHADTVDDVLPHGFGGTAYGHRVFPTVFAGFACAVISFPV